MKKTELKDAVATLRAALAALKLSVVSPDLGAAIGALHAGAEEAIAEARLGADLLACFRAAGAAGATFESMGRTRATIMEFAPAYWPGRAVRAACLQMALAEESRALSLVTLKSRSDADDWLARMNAAFDPAEDAAAEDEDQTSFRAIVALHAAVANDLATRGRPLPRMVSFSFAKRLPALAMANRFYGDAARSDELIDENRVVHPLFMPDVGRALAQ